MATGILVNGGEDEKELKEGEDKVKKDLSAFKNRFGRLSEKKLQVGDAWYLIECHWFARLKEYLDEKYFGSESKHPGPIDNTDLFETDSEGRLKQHLIDEEHYSLVHQECWDLLVEKFGLVFDQKPIKRNVISIGCFSQVKQVEVYFLELSLAQYSEISNPQSYVKCSFSKTSTLASIDKKMRELFDIDSQTETRLWNAFDKQKLVRCLDPEFTIIKSNITSGHNIIIEPKNPDGTWPKGSDGDAAAATTTAGTSSGSSNSASSSNDNQTSDKRGGMPSISSSMPMHYNFGSHSEGGTSDKARPGICGLSNLGNTCFMNSIIQLLSNTPPIIEYFANGNYIEDINKDNPIGMKGEIATTFGQLIKNMWSGKYSYVVPRAFKMAVGRFAPQFSGYQQQDSQELLTFLLDGLHEDLNRVRKKPYIELKDNGDRPNEEIAAEAWETYKTRNDSVILDLFHGLLKSTLVCPVCSKISVTFDPFCYLSLPLPVRKERQIEVIFVSTDEFNVPTIYKLTVPKHGVIRDLCKVLSKKCGVDPRNLIVTEVFSNKFHKIYADEDHLKNIIDRDIIYVYEVIASDEDTVILPVYFGLRGSSSVFQSPNKLFARPLLIGVPKRGTTPESLYNAVVHHMRRFVKQPSEAVNGEVEEEEEEGDNPTKVSSVPMDDEEDDEDDEEEGEEEETTPARMFRMSFVNSYGSSHAELNKNWNAPLELNDRYLSLDWSPKTKKLYYLDKKAEEIRKDDSMDYRQQKEQVVKLEECLELYTSKEKLSENDAWYCPKCSKHREASKKFDLWSLPSVLVISLKRFSYTRNWRDKLDTLVEFPTSGLDMAPYVINENHGKAVYDLIAVSNHYGGMGGGHYTAYGKNKDGGQWYYFDDSNVSPSSEKQVVTRAAYVLFYKRREGSPSSTCTSSAYNNGASVNGTINDNGDASSEDEVEKMDIN